MRSFQVSRWVLHSLTVFHHNAKPKKNLNPQKENETSYCCDCWCFSAGKTKKQSEWESKEQGAENPYRKQQKNTVNYAAFYTLCFPDCRHRLPTTCAVLLQHIGVYMWTGLRCSAYWNTELQDGCGSIGSRPLCVVQREFFTPATGDLCLLYTAHSKHGPAAQTSILQHSYWLLTEG